MNDTRFTNISIHLEATNDKTIMLLKPSGKLNKEVISQVATFIDKNTKEDPNHKLNLMLDTTEFDGWEYDAFIEDVKLSIKHRNDVRKIALFGNQIWLEVAATLASFATRAEVEYFDNKAKAIEWLRH
ncbi:STAS/SEC14 domain-containing protein [Vibrio maritimus]|uniref:STAS/SEC14 domain-containing protein n=1 Tax=Vibrio maritimus TaxID=990268 RepID=UPI004067F77C